ncbi:hypothetical protein [Candidatus Litorirhabdus singularis]|uniref:hypothetical protein n=1 Tax=Candidatus Litorirhabdus singularis TaxID=2518993 RepID=UPI00242B0825|nr:hypothetical protein [Candidatus Litorirhabdus singularis]
MTDQGRSTAYIEGFHDGRHSGIYEAGNAFEHFIRDESRYQTEADYQTGWLAGETEGKRLQLQAAQAGNAAAQAYSSARIAEATDGDAMAKDAVKGIDTSGMGSLSK